MKTRIAVAFSALLLLCPSVFAAQPVELRMSWWGGNSRHQATLKALAAFEKKYPDIKVKAEYTGWEGHQSRLSTQIASGTEPDIMQTNWPWLPIFSKDGNGYYDIYQLKEWVDLTQFDARDLLPVTLNGKLNGLPISVNAPVFYYNTETWKQAGIAYPETWEALFAAGKTFKEKLGNDYYPLVMVNQDVLLMINSYMMQKYNLPMFDAQKKIMPWSDEQWLDAFRFLQRLKDDHVIPGPRTLASYGKGYDYEMKPWINNKWGGAYTWNVSVRMYINNLAPPATLVTGKYPVLPQAKDAGIYFKVAQMFSVAKSTKHPREAAMLLNFLLNDKDAALALGLERGIPLGKTAVETLTRHEVIKKNDPMVAGLNLVQALPSNMVATPWIEDNQIVDQFTTAWENMDYGRQTTGQAAATFKQQAERILRKLTRARDR